MEVIELPNKVTLDNVLTLINLTQQSFNNGNEILFDFSKVSFVDPFGANFLVLLIKNLENKGIKINVNILELNSDVFDYLNRMNFFDKLGIDYLEYPHVKHDSNNRFLEMKEIYSIEEIPDVEKHFQKVIKDEDLARFLGYQIRELLDNIFSHAESSIGALLMSQKYHSSSTEKIIFSVGDLGVGIPATLKPFFQNISMDHLLIEKSLDFGVSSKKNSGIYFGSDHRGAGLYYIKRYVQMNKWNLLVISKKGLYFIKRGKETIKKEFKYNIIDGTLFALSINNENIFDYDILHEMLLNETSEYLNKNVNSDIILDEDFDEEW
ncbi:Histidine kinase [Marinitoga phage MPV1]|uniref:Histidine kinase,STAS domain-containing protein n=1 Tax=Marinitoga piezophila (strain DSM 14283 / JCM 11233 / KA3) TaxID=443254 RepID=H2J417_MARPK|nr:STAS domain-containing protein [Marinitoga piezophila]AEX84745.1 histidine kinase,STAS domain-containing protein [Marinitoga piezophila KA3]